MKIWSVVSATIFAAAVLASILGGGCTDDDHITNLGTIPPNFVMSPDTLYLSDRHLVDTLLMSLDAPGSVTWMVTAAPSWLRVEPDSGTATQAIREIFVTADSAGKTVGTYRGALEIISTAGGERVGLLFEIALHPKAVLTLDSIDFGEQDTLRSFYIRSEGNGSLQWALTSSVSWCRVLYPSNGWLNPGDSTLVRLSVSRNDMDPGAVESVLTLVSNADDPTLEIPVSMTVRAAARLVPLDSAVVFGLLQDTTTLRVRNAGNIATGVVITFDVDYVNCSPALSTVAKTDSTDLTLSLNRNGLPSDTLPIRASMFLESDSGRVDTVRLYVYNYAPNILSVPFTILDAEYSRTLDKIAAVSTSPSRFLLIDPETGSVQSLDLVLPPTCVAIRFDGVYAVVGHDALVTYIDVATMQVINTWPVTAEAVDIILPSNGWAYVFPKRDQWSTIRCIELSTGLDIPHRGGSIYAGTKGRLHPSEDFIYGANNGLSPSDFEKYDIRNDTLIFMYDSPYHGDYSFSGDVWISDDGQKLFARSCNIFSSDATRSIDMIYRGKLAGLQTVRWAEHSSMAGRVYVLGANSGYPVQLNAYEDDFFAYRGRIGLPKFINSTVAGGQLVPTEGKFVFAARSGMRLYVLLTGQQGTPFNFTWGIAAFDTADLP